MHSPAQLQCLRERALPDIAAKNQPCRTGIHRGARLLDDVALTLHLAAAEEYQLTAGGLDHHARRLFLADLKRVVGFGRGLILLRIQLRHVDLDNVGPEFESDTSRVIDGIQAVASTLHVNCLTAWIRPDND